MVCVVCGSKEGRIQIISGYEFWKCEKCGLTRLLTKSKEDDLYKFEDARRHLVKVSPLSALIYKFKAQWILDWYYKFVFNSRRKIVEKYVLNGKILDVGCAQGEFLGYLDSNKWSLFGIELNANMAKNARKMVPKARIYTQKMEDFKENEKFDVITLWHVWEHLEEVKTQMAKLKSMLKPGGYLVMEMPNGESVWRKVFGKHWRMWMVPQHKWLWTAKSMRMFLEKNGFNVIKTCGEGLISSGPGSAVDWSGSIWLGVLMAPVCVIVNILAGKHRDNLVTIGR